MIDPPGRVRANIHELPKSTAATNYQQNCAICHTSQSPRPCSTPTIFCQVPIVKRAMALLPGTPYLRGTAQCAACHSPHLADFEHNKISLKSHTNPNELCLGCHPKFRHCVALDGPHSAGTEASQCVSCHRPRLMNALLFKALSHRIEIPSAGLSGRFRQQDSPNVCLTCHAEKTAVWAKEQLAAWPH